MIYLFVTQSQKPVTDQFLCDIWKWYVIIWFKQKVLTSSSSITVLIMNEPQLKRINLLRSVSSFEYINKTIRLENFGVNFLRNCEWCVALLLQIEKAWEEF